MLVLCMPLLVHAADVSGNWSLRLVRFGEEFGSARVELKSEGGKVTGTLNELKLEGTTDGDQVKITAWRPDGKEWGKFEGRVQGDEIAGTVKQPEDEFAWKARRDRAASGAPKTHTFEPVAFHRVFSGAIAPVLRINPGDTIRTTTVDAGGRDAKGVRRSLGGNPETGPFFVEGAMPGDTLAIKFLRIRLNRDSAGSGDRIVPSAVQPGYFRNAKFDDNFNSEWKLDREAGVASLAKPTDRMKNFRVKMQPMLGCVGVAPPASQSFRSGWLGSWGGNMDYSGLREGVTVYLPVYQEGALLFVGDGHALSGDGELTGDALETSMDVEFTVDLIKKNVVSWPRLENDTYLMVLGSERPLLQALQHATTEMHRLLVADFKYSEHGASLLMGQAMEYEIANVVDPHFTVVAKLRKSLLPR